jgi:hypothetical protein
MARNCCSAQSICAWMSAPASGSVPPALLADDQQRVADQTEAYS